MGASDDLIANHTFDELQPGQHAQALRTLTLADIQAFALVCGDQPEAPPAAGAADAPDGAGSVSGMGAGVLISALLGSEFPGAGTQVLSQALDFHRMVRLGDTLSTRVSVRDKDSASGRVMLQCAVRNQHGELVVTGSAVVLAPQAKLLRPRTGTPTLHLFDPDARLAAWVQTLLQGPQRGPALACAVVHPCDEPALRAALQAAALGLIVPTLVGPAGRIRALAHKLDLDLAGLALDDVPHSHAAAARGAALAASGEVALLVKGSLHTDELLRALLAEPALRTGRRLSHVFHIEVPAHARPLLVTDAAVNIAPTLEEKADILRNAIDLAHALGIARPHAALLSAVETVTPRLPSTLDAAALCKMADRGQITGALVDGPLAFDNAISAEAARIKGIRSAVAGAADILLVPDLEAGNMLAKQLAWLAGAASCGVVLGARVPVALTSRADSVASRVASVALAALLAWHQQRQPGPAAPPPAA